MVSRAGASLCILLAGGAAARSHCDFVRWHCTFIHFEHAAHAVFASSVLGVFGASHVLGEGLLRFDPPEHAPRASDIALRWHRQPVNLYRLASRMRYIVWDYGEYTIQLVLTIRSRIGIHPNQ